MHLFALRGFCRNNFIISLFLVVFSLLWIFAPHIVVELHDHNDFEGLFRQVGKHNKLAETIKKMLKQLCEFLHKIFCTIQDVLHISTPSHSQWALFQLSFSSVLFQHLLSILSAYYFGSEYRQSIQV